MAFFLECHFVPVNPRKVDKCNLSGDGGDVLQATFFLSSFHHQCRYGSTHTHLLNEITWNALFPRMNKRLYSRVIC